MIPVPPARRPARGRALAAVLLAAAACVATPPEADAPEAPGARIQLRLDPSEADAVLAIAGRVRAHAAVPDSAWQRLFATEPYLRLERREAAMRRPFTRDDFRAFVLSPALAARADSLRATLAAWERADLVASARRVLAYLPDTARIRARVYPVIKPQTNSFVFEPETNPAIFLALDPGESEAKFESTVAHELHHIGFASVAGSHATMVSDLPPRVRRVVEWMSAFGEGFAMLAAAGGPDADPHAASPPAERARWNRDLGHFGADLDSLQAFFTGILDGRLASDDDIRRAGYAFFGVQGPWYTVGYQMAVVVERRFGRPVLIACMLDPRRLLVRYNTAAADSNRVGGRLPTWSADLLAKLGANE